MCLVACANRGMVAYSGGAGSDSGRDALGEDLPPSNSGGAAGTIVDAATDKGGAAGAGGRSQMAGTTGSGGSAGWGGTTGGGGSRTGGTGGSAGSNGWGTGGATGGVGSAGAAGSNADAGIDARKAPTLLAYYPFDQTAGPTIPDLSGNSHNGTLAGTATFPAGLIGNDLSLPGTTSSYVSLPNALVAGLTDATIAAWVRVRTDKLWQRVFDFGTGTMVYMYLTSHADLTNVVRFSITLKGNTNEQRLDGKAILPVGVWTHVAIVLGTGGGTLYINGAVVATNPALALRPSDLGATTNTWLGRSPFSGDPGFDGEIDEFRIYPSALTPGEVAALYSDR
jgi:Concanavalin A-like lectin/glucanases superfamily